MSGALRQRMKLGLTVGRSITRTFSTNDQQKYLDTTYGNGVRTITLSHLPTRNSLSLNMMKSLIDNITKDQNDSTLRSIVIRAAPGKVFSAGYNLKELMSNNDVNYHKEFFGIAEDLMQALMRSPVPIIAAVDGLAAASGCQLVAACDIAVCTENSSFSTSGVNFGIFCHTPGVAVARNVPRKVAAHMLFTGIPISAQEALRVGLVSKVLPDAKELDAEVETIVGAVNAKSRSVVSLGKRFFYQQIDVDTTTAYSLGTDVMLENSQMKDGQEGMRSFVEKRTPIWTHSDDKND